MSDAALRELAENVIHSTNWASTINDMRDRAVEIRSLERLAVWLQDHPQISTSTELTDEALAMVMLETEGDYLAEKRDMPRKMWADWTMIDAGTRDRYTRMAGAVRAAVRSDQAATNAAITDQMRTMMTHYGQIYDEKIIGINCWQLGQWIEALERIAAHPAPPIETTGDADA